MARQAWKERKKRRVDSNASLAPTVSTPATGHEHGNAGLNDQDGVSEEQPNKVRTT